MTFMVIEKFKSDKVRELYQRFDEKGRMLPEGVYYINSWITENLETCYQVMEAESEAKLQEWVALWSDLADFEYSRTISSVEAKAKIL